MSEYSQVRSFNLGIAMDTSLEAALIYDDLAYAQNIVGKNKWFYRSYEQLLRRLPVMSERTARNAVNQLEADGWIIKKIMKLNGSPVCHYQVCRFLSAKSAETDSAKIAETMESAKFAETSIYKTTKETTKGAEAPSAPKEEVKNLLAEIISLVNPKEKPTDARLRMLNARLADKYTPDEIRKAAQAFSQSQWHKDNKQMSIDNLLAPSKFGRWYQQGQEVGQDATDVDYAIAHGLIYKGKITPEIQAKLLEAQKAKQDGDN